MFFLSGAAGLMYEMVWVRSLLNSFDARQWANMTIAFSYTYMVVPSFFMGLAFPLPEM